MIHLQIYILRRSSVRDSSIRPADIYDIITAYLPHHISMAFGYLVSPPPLSPRFKPSMARQAHYLSIR
jgi:hypothetical protein